MKINHRMVWIVSAIILCLSSVLPVSASQNATEGLSTTLSLIPPTHVAGQSVSVPGGHSPLLLDVLLKARAQAAKLPQAKARPAARPNAAALGGSGPQIAQVSTNAWRSLGPSAINLGGSAYSGRVTALVAGFNIDERL